MPGNKLGWIGPQEFEWILAKTGWKVSICFVPNALGNAMMMSGWLKKGHEKYRKVGKLAFMEQISIEGKTNFFEKRVGEYALANKTKDEKTFDLESEF